MQEIKHKIVYLSDDFPPEVLGGAGLIAYEEAVAVAERGHKVTVITTTQDKEKVGERIEKGIKIISIYSNYNPRWRGYVSIYNKNVVRRVESILKEERPDIIHAHNIHAHLSYAVLAVARRYAEKMFLTAHDALLVYFGKFVPTKDGLKANPWQNFKEHKFRYNPFRKFLISYYLTNVDTVFAVSDALREFLEKNGVERVVTLHNGIEKERWTADSDKVESYKNKYDLQNKKVILFAGRVSGLKGGNIIRETFKSVHEKMEDARLFIVGSSHERSQTGVIFTGTVPREDMKYMYAVADVVVVPSLYLDPFPTINLEAMASRKPVVGTILGGTKEAVEDGRTGFIVDPNNTQLFADKILHILENHELREKMGSAAYERFLEKFTIETHIKNLLAWYNGAQK